MTRPAVHVQIDNETAVLETLALVSKLGARAQLSALRDAGRKARSLAAKVVTAGLGVPQKVLRKRIQVFIRRPKTPIVTTGRLWGGIARPPTAASHPKVLSVLQSRYPEGRLVHRKRWGRVGWMTDRGRGHWFEERLLFDRGEVGSALENGVREAMTTVYPKRLRGQLRRLTQQKIVGRPRRRSRRRT